MAAQGVESREAAMGRFEPAVLAGHICLVRGDEVTDVLDAWGGQVETGRGETGDGGFEVEEDPIRGFPDGFAGKAGGQGMLEGWDGERWAEGRQVR